MFAARALRSSAPALRRVQQRRLQSSLQGAQDNAFNRERQAVKDHAAATSGTLSSTEEEYGKMRCLGDVIAHDQGC